MTAPDIWRIHIDITVDVIPVADRFEALREAQAVNAATIAYVERVAREAPASVDYLPTVWARPVAPGGEA